MSICEVIAKLLFFTVGPYLEHPELINTLPRGLKSVTGLTVLLDQVFIVRVDTREMEIYNSGTLMLTNRLQVDGLKNPRDLTSCSKFRCLYISDGGGLKIHRVELNGATTRWKLNDEPWIRNPAPDGLSVTPEPDFHVLVTCPYALKLKEFTTNGVPIREIRLQEELVHPLHAIQFNGQFIVAHGFETDPLHRVCIVNTTGHVTRCYGGPRGSAVGQLDGPRHLAVDSEGNVVIADLGNERVLLLNETLKYVGDLVSTYKGNRSKFHPFRLHLDTRGKMLVVDHINMDVLMFQVRN